MKLLVVEDDDKIRLLLTEALEQDGYQTTQVSSAEDALAAGAGHDYEGYVLDVLLPGMSGYDLCRWLRDHGVKDPILLLTAKAGLSDKIEGLDAGADDYLTKPFELAEVKARLRALHRKVQGYPRPELRVADLVVDPNSKTARRGERILELSPKEFRLLEYLVRNAGRLVTRAMIANAVWDSDTSFYTNVIDVLINSLRKRVDGASLPKLILTVRGQGFMVGRDPETGTD
jgi:DNA-binding response OmpR family regulator